jgi:spore maturation protein CgeB
VKVLCVFGEHNYGNPERGDSYEYVNFLPALRNLGHEVVFFESFNRSRYQNFAALNRKLLERVKTYRPDVVICVLLGYEVWLETLQLICDQSTATLINWSTDDSWKYEQFSKLVAPVFHLYATTYASAVEKAKKDGHKNFYLTQWAANSNSMQKPLPASECKYLVTFIGTAYGKRPQLVSRLAEEGIKVECFGFGWKNGPVHAEDIPRIMRESVISLNFGDSGVQWKGIRPVRSRQIKARIFEVPGAGGFLITEHAEELKKFYSPDEIETFEGVEELVSKIRIYLKHYADRDRIANSGYQRTIDQHTYELRFNKLLDAAKNKKINRAEHLTSEIDMEMFSVIEKKHQVGIALRLFGQLWRVPFILLWGKVRGPRAARRLMFELSWRLIGRKTYSASGWTGRLFYQES